MEIPETDQQQPEVQGVAIYSKLAVLLFSIFFDPLIGGILLMLNLRSVGYKRQGTIVMLFAAGYYFVSSFLMSYVATILGVKLTMEAMLSNPKVIIILLVLKIIGGGILAEYFYRKYFPYNDYEHKSIWKPLIITIAGIMLLSTLIRL